MIGAIDRFARELSRYYSPVTVIEGAIVDYNGIAVSVTEALFPAPSLGGKNVKLSVDLDLRSMDFSSVFKVAGFVAGYPGFTNSVQVDFGVADAEAGGGECLISFDLIADLEYPTGYVLVSDATTAVNIRYENGEVVLRDYG